MLWVSREIRLIPSQITRYDSMIIQYGKDPISIYKLPQNHEPTGVLNTAQDKQASS